MNLFNIYLYITKTTKNKMGIKELLNKLTPKPIEASDKPKLSSDEMELESYKREDRRDEIRRELQQYRKKKLTQFLSGSVNSSRKKVEGEITKDVTDKIKREAYFKEAKRLAGVSGKKEALNSIKQSPEYKNKLKQLKGLLRKSKKKSKGKTQKIKKDGLIAKPTKTKLHYVYGEPRGMVTGSDILSSGNFFSNPNHINNQKKSKNILNEGSSFFR